MTISIFLPENEGRPATSSGVKILNGETSEEIKDIYSVTVNMVPSGIVIATVEVAVSGNSDMKNIHALLGTKTLDEILKMHGLKIDG